MFAKDGFVWHDGDGRLVQRRLDGDLWQYRYGLDGRLAKVSVNGTEVASYQHNALGQRVVRTYGSATEHVHYGLSGERLAESADDGDLLLGWIWLYDSVSGGRPVAQFVPDGQGGHVISVIAADQLGQPAKLLEDASGATLTWQRGALPFGASLAMLTGGALDEPTRLPGQYEDAATALHYNYHRDYDPLWGRYLQPDPIGLSSGDVNLYAYVWNDPLHLTDPDGLQSSGPGGFNKFPPAVQRTLLETNRWAKDGPWKPHERLPEPNQQLPQPIPSVADFSSQELAIIEEARNIMQSPEWSSICSAHSAGSDAETKIGNRTIVYSPDLPLDTPGMVLFEEDGFVLGPRAFEDSTQLAKTVLHELHRLHTSESASGLHSELASQETSAASNFANRAAGALGQ